MFIYLYIICQTVADGIGTPDTDPKHVVINLMCLIEFS